MKGIVFTEFAEMVEEQFGPDTLELMIAGADLPNGVAYTAVGSYDHGEIIRMVGQLSALTGVEGRQLVRVFGEHLFQRLAAAHPQLCAETSTFALLASVGPHIHMEVRKLYPEAELPIIDCRLLEPARMELMYRSTRPFGDLAEGLIHGCIRHFGESIDVAREDLSASSGHCVRFTLSAAAA